jgi:hypothetical protein
MAPDSIRRQILGDLEDHFGLLIVDEGGSIPINYLNSGASDTYPSIPARVESEVPLLIRPSPAKREGYGVFIKEGVKAGELVYTVKKPILNIVSSSALQVTIPRLMAF